MTIEANSDAAIIRFRACMAERGYVERPPS